MTAKNKANGSREQATSTSNTAQSYEVQPVSFMVFPKRQNGITRAMWFPRSRGLGAELPFEMLVHARALEAQVATSSMLKSASRTSKRREYR